MKGGIIFRTLCHLWNLLQSLIHSGNGERTPESPEPHCLRGRSYPQKEHHHHSQAQSPPPVASLSSWGRPAAPARAASALPTPCPAPPAEERVQPPRWSHVSYVGQGGDNKIDARKALGTVRWFNVKNINSFINRNMTPRKMYLYVPQPWRRITPESTYLRSVGNGDYGVWRCWTAEGAEAAKVSGSGGGPAQCGERNANRNHYGGSACPPGQCAQLSHAFPRRMTGIVRVQEAWRTEECSRRPGPAPPVLPQATVPPTCGDRLVATTIFQPSCAGRQDGGCSPPGCRRTR